MNFTIKRMPPDELRHYGIKGQKWGLRRFENLDGTLTEEGKTRYRTYKVEAERDYNIAKYDAKKAHNKYDAVKDRKGIKAFLTGNIIKKAIAKKKAIEADDKLKEVEDAYKEILKYKDQIQADNKKSFEKSRENIAKNGMMAWWNEARASNEEDKFFDHIWESQGKLLDSWWNKRYEADTDEKWFKLQSRYSHQLAKNLGIPQTKENIAFLSDWFINGDD